MAGRLAETVSDRTLKSGLTADSADSGNDLGVSVYSASPSTSVQKKSSAISEKISAQDAAASPKPRVDA